MLSAEAQAQSLAAGTAEHREAVGRFLNKQAPLFAWPARKDGSDQRSFLGAVSDRDQCPDVVRHRGQRSLLLQAAPNQGQSLSSAIRKTRFSIRRLFRITESRKIQQPQWGDAGSPVVHPVT